MANFTVDDINYLFLSDCKVIGGVKETPISFLFPEYWLNNFKTYEKSVSRPYETILYLFSDEPEYKKTLDNIVSIFDAMKNVDKAQSQDSKIVDFFSKKMEKEINSLCSFDIDFEKKSNLYASLLASVYHNPSDIFGVYKKKFQKSKNNHNLLGDKLYELYQSNSKVVWGNKEYSVFSMINANHKAALASAFTISLSSNKDLNFEQSMEVVRDALGPFNNKLLSMMYYNCLKTVAKEKNVSKEEFKKEFDIFIDILEKNKNSHLIDLFTESFVKDGLLYQENEPKKLDLVLSSGISVEYTQTLALSNDSLMKLFNKSLVKVEEYQRFMLQCFESWSDTSFSKEEQAQIDVRRTQIKNEDTGYKLIFKSQNLDLLKRIEKNFEFFLTVVPLFDTNKSREEMGNHFRNVLDSAFHKKIMNDDIQKVIKEDTNITSMGGFKL